MMNVSDPQCISKPLLIEESICGALGALPCRLSFHVSHFSNLAHKGTINFVKEIGGISSPLFGILSEKEKRRVLNNSPSL